MFLELVELLVRTCFLLQEIKRNQIPYNMLFPEVHKERNEKK